MKKLGMLIMLLLTLALMPALAEEMSDGSYVINLPDAQITFTPPEGTVCLTMETSASVFRNLGLSQRDLFAFMEESDLQALLIDVETGTEYQIYAYPWDDVSYDLADEAAAQRICTDTMQILRDQGYDVKACSMYQNTGHAYTYVDADYTYEDGHVEPTLMLLTRQFGCEVDIYAYPPEGEGTDFVKETAMVLADSVTIAKAPLTVTTEEKENGDFVLTVDDLALTFTPIDIRFAVTRLSSRAMFNRMGWNQAEELAIMETNDIYALLYDRHQRACIQVHAYGHPNTQNYSDMMDWMVTAVEKNFYTTYGWTVEKCELFKGSALKFIKATVSRANEDGTMDRRMIYATCTDGARIEIQVFAAGEKILEMVEDQTDAFVRNIRAE